MQARRESYEKVISHPAKIPRQVDLHRTGRPKKKRAEWLGIPSREEIQAATDSFLEQGGKIKVLSPDAGLWTSTEWAEIEDVADLGEEIGC